MVGKLSHGGSPWRGAGGDGAGAGGVVGRQCCGGAGGEGLSLARRQAGSGAKRRRQRAGGGGRAAAAPEPEVPMKPGTHRAGQSGPPDGSHGQPGPPRPPQQVSGEVRAGFGGRAGRLGWMAAVPVLSSRPPPRQGSSSPFVLALGQWLCGTEAQLQVCALGSWGGTPKLHSQGCGVP